MTTPEIRNDATPVWTLFVMVTVVAIFFATTRWTGTMLWPISMPVTCGAVLGTLYSVMRLEPGVETGTALGTVLGAMLGCAIQGPVGLVLILPCAWLGLKLTRFVLPFDSLKSP